MKHKKLFLYILPFRQDERRMERRLQQKALLQCCLLEPLSLLLQKNFFLLRSYSVLILCKVSFLSLFQLVKDFLSCRDMVRQINRQKVNLLACESKKKKKWIKNSGFSSLRRIRWFGKRRRTKQKSKKLFVWHDIQRSGSATLLVSIYFYKNKYKLELFRGIHFSFIKKMHQKKVSSHCHIKGF